MTAVYEVRFKGNRNEYFAWAGPDPLPPRQPVIVEVERGEDLGRVSAAGTAALTKCARGCGGCSLEEAATRATRRILRRAGPDDLRAAEALRREEDAVRKRVRERVLHHGLAMKVSDAEWQWDRRKLTVYFTAESRVDFRALVRDLAGIFRTRIELRQIGARDEARRLDGVGRCGRQYCSASWLPELRPVNLSVAKDQMLSLNPAQISGPCGRLLCCLHYEHDFYVESRKRFPKEGRVLRTARGEERVAAIDIFRETVTLRSADGAARVVPLAALKAELGEPAAAPPAAPAEPAPPAAAPAPAPPAAPAEPASPTAEPGRRRRRRRRHRGGEPPVA